MTYAERLPSSDLGRFVRCVWAHEGGAGSGEPFRVLPDGCVDVVWNGASLRVAGPDTGPVLEALPAGAPVSGIRFHPGAAPALLGVPASAIRDARVPLASLWGADAVRLSEALSEAGSVEERAALLERAMAGRAVRAGAPDPLVGALVRRLAQGGQGRLEGLDGLAGELGVSTRQLLRRCTAAVGYGPKVLERVLRFQEVMRRMQAEPEVPLGRLAAAVGYADQAHLAHETAALGGLTPGALREVVR